MGAFRVPNSSAVVEHRSTASGCGVEPHGSAKRGNQRRQPLETASPRVEPVTPLPTPSRAPENVLEAVSGWSGGRRAAASTGCGVAEAGPTPERSDGVGAAEAKPLPCLNRNNSNETGPKRHLELTPGARKTAFGLQENVRHLAESYGLESLGFLTLTFADHVTDAREAGRRFNSLAAGVLRERYRHYICVLERMKSGRIHFHLVVVMPDGVDIRSGVQFWQLEEGNYQSAPPSLRSEWAFWRRTAKVYGFGRTELLPIYSTSEAIGKYVGKYIAKHMEQREERDKGVRLVRYSQGDRKVRGQFAWVSPGAKSWRLGVGALIWGHFMAGRISSPTERGMYLRYGPKWAWYWRDVIAGYAGRPDSAV